MKALLLLIVLICAPAYGDLVYHHDSNGNAVSGNKQALIDGAMSGRDVKVKVNYFTPSIYNTSNLQLHHLNGEDVLCALVYLPVINIQTPSNFVIPKHSYAANFCTNGHEYVKHSIGTQIDNILEMYWYFD